MFRFGRCYMQCAKDNSNCISTSDLVELPAYCFPLFSTKQQRQLAVSIDSKSGTNFFPPSAQKNQAKVMAELSKLATFSLEASIKIKDHLHILVSSAFFGLDDVNTFREETLETTLYTKGQKWV